MRLLLLFGLLLLAAPLARARQSGLTAYSLGCSATAIATPATPPDTVAALRHLFAAERRTGRKLLIVAGTAAGAGGLIAVVGNSSLAAVVFGGAFFVVGLVAAIPSAIHLAAYSRGREERMVQAWQQRRLPRRVRRQLLPSHFADAPPVP